MRPLLRLRRDGQLSMPHQRDHGVDLGFSVMSKSTDNHGFNPVGEEVLHRLSWLRSLF
jgi:hypothetical protein